MTNSQSKLMEHARNIYYFGKIYKITSPHTDKIYIGSTVQPLKQRFSAHKYEYKKNNYNCSSRIIFDFGDCNIELIKDYQCNNKKELEAEEMKYIISSNVVNIRKSTGYTIPPRREKRQLIYYTCECGWDLCSLAYKKGHERSKIHQQYLSSLI